MTTLISVTPLVPAPKPGIYPNIPAAVYHSWTGASNSRLAKLRDGKTPAHLKASMEEPREDTTALKIGRASHTAILEPQEFDFSFAVADQCAALVKSGDRKGEQCSNPGVLFSATSGGWLCGQHGKGLVTDEDRLVLSADNYETCMHVRDAMHAHGSARGMMIAPRATELSLVWIDPETGVQCKARPDCYNPKLAGGTMWDIKTAENASEAAFERAIFDRCYHGQAAFYTDGALVLGLPVQQFVFAAVEKKAPYEVATYTLKQDALDDGRAEIRRGLATYAECIKTNVWPGYSPRVRYIGLPEWARRKLDRANRDDFTATVTANVERVA